MIELAIGAGTGLETRTLVNISIQPDFLDIDQITFNLHSFFKSNLELLVIMLFNYYHYDLVLIPVYCILNWCGFFFCFGVLFIL